MHKLLQQRPSLEHVLVSRLGVPLLKAIATDMATVQAHARKQLFAEFAAATMTALKQHALRAAAASLGAAALLNANDAAMQMVR
jgi:hypothetical protein